MDELFNNIFIYLPIILIVLFRVLGLRNRRAGQRPPAAAASPETPAPEKPPEKRPRKEPPRISRIPSGEVLFPEIPPAPAVPAKVPAARTAEGGFPGNLNYLPALKRAMVLTEIMGPPKALRGGRDGCLEPPWGTA
jgi:hypothetical protein